MQSVVSYRPSLYTFCSSQTAVPRKPFINDQLLFSSASTLQKSAEDALKAGALSELQLSPDGQSLSFACNGIAYNVKGKSGQLMKTKPAITQTALTAKDYEGLYSLALERLRQYPGIERLWHADTLASFMSGLRPGVTGRFEQGRWILDISQQPDTRLRALAEHQLSLYLSEQKSPLSYLDEAIQSGRLDILTLLGGLPSPQNPYMAQIASYDKEPITLCYPINKVSSLSGSSDSQVESLLRLSNIETIPDFERLREVYRACLEKAEAVSIQRGPHMTTIELQLPNDNQIKLAASNIDNRVTVHSGPTDLTLKLDASQAEQLCDDSAQFLFKNTDWAKGIRSLFDRNIMPYYLVSANQQLEYQGICSQHMAILLTALDKNAPLKLTGHLQNKDIDVSIQDAQLCQWVVGMRKILGHSLSLPYAFSTNDYSGIATTTPPPASKN